MNPILRNILAVVVALVVGGAANMGILMIGSNLIPPPAGIDATDMEQLKANIHLFQPKHFLFPFLAHAGGTFIGALLVALIAVSHQMKFALGIGGVFLLGGIANAFMLPAPVWFIVADLLLAYLPVAWIGGKLGHRTTPATN